VPVCDPVDIIVMNEPVVLFHFELEGPGVGVSGAKLIVNPVHVVRQTLIWVGMGLMRGCRRGVEPRTRGRRSRTKKGTGREGPQRTGRTRRKRRQRKSRRPAQRKKGWEIEIRETRRGENIRTVRSDRPPRGLSRGSVHILTPDLT
jgi:hypothetical protein